MKKVLKKIRRKLGDLVRGKKIRVPKATGAQRKDDLPFGAVEYFQADHPYLKELRERYEASGLPMAVHSWWGSERTTKDLELAWFRGDNAYVWQTRHMGVSAHTRYYLYARDVLERDAMGLAKTLQEDGGFGCWLFEYETIPNFSRDLLDSINEINFLEQHLEVSSGAVREILDIGAGYGRLAHRSYEAWPSLEKYHCTDGVAESTFICDYYIKHRKITDKVNVLALDEVPKFEGGDVDLVINIHSFSEMRYEAIEGWFERIRHWNVQNLLIVPNDADEFLSIEMDHSRRDFLPLIESMGYTLKVKRPVIEDADIRKMVGVEDNFYLFQLS